MSKVDLDGNAIKPMTICVIGAGGFIGSHLCETLIKATSHKIVAVEIYDGEIPRTAKIKHLLEPVESRLRMVFHGIKTADFPLVQGFIKNADLIVYLGCVACTPNNKARDNIYGYVTEAMQIVKYCSDNQKRLIHFSSGEVYGKTIGSYLPKDHPLREDPSLYLLKEDNSPCIFGSIEKQRWSYACAKQLVERLIYAEGVENGLEFTIVRPFNWIGPRMDFIPGVDGPRDGVPPVLTGFTYRLIRGESLKLVDGGESQRTFACINDAMEAVVLMIENPEKANGYIFNVGNPNNEVTIRQLAGMMTEVYAKVSGEEAIKKPTVDVSSKDFYGEGYDDSDKRIPDITIINRQLGWVPKTALKDMLESFLTSQYSTYYETVKALQIKENINSLKERKKRGEADKAKKRAEKKANNIAVQQSQKLTAQATNVSNRVKGLDGLFQKI